MTWESRTLISEELCPNSKTKDSQDSHSETAASSVLLTFRLLMISGTCEVGDTVLNTLLVFYILTFLVLTTTLWGIYYIVPILWRKKLRLREVK